MAPVASFIPKKRHGYQLLILPHKQLRIPIISKPSEEADFFSTMLKNDIILYLQSRKFLTHGQLEQLIEKMNLSEYVTELRNQTIRKLGLIPKQSL